MLLQAGFTLGYVASTPLMSRVGRRAQFIASGTLMAAAMMSLGLTMNLQVF